MTRAKITRDEIADDFRNNAINDTLTEQLEARLIAIDKERDVTEKLLERLEDIRDISSDVTGVTAFGVPYREDLGGDFEEVGEWRNDLRNVYIRIRTKDGLTHDLYYKDSYPERPFTYILETDDECDIGINENWTDLEYVRSLALHYLDTGNLPVVEEFDYYLVWGIGRSEYGKSKIGKDKDEAQRVVEFAQKHNIADYRYWLEAVRLG